jgi:threonine/homoserine/homoserine lactone efflux protein
MSPAAILDHKFVIAAYTVTWILQLGYLTWIGLRWRAEKRNADRRGQRSR